MPDKVFGCKIACQTRLTASLATSFSKVNVMIQTTKRRIISALLLTCFALPLTAAAEPACIMAGGAGWKMVPSMTRPFELVDNLVFEGLLALGAQRFAKAAA